MRGVPQLVAGRFGEAFDFARDDSAVDVPTLPLVTAPGAFHSVSLWFFRAGPSVDEALFYLPATPVADAPRYDLGLTDVFGTMSLCINAGFGDCFGVQDPNLVGRWVHVVAVFANGRIGDGRMFVDGQDVGTCITAPCDNVRTVANPVVFGANERRYDYRGLIDDVRIYGRALELSEARALLVCGQ
jgi:hypothetical protein